MAHIGYVWHNKGGFRRAPNQTTEGSFKYFDNAYESPWAWLASVKEDYMKAKKGTGKKGGGGKKC